MKYNDISIKKWNEKQLNKDDNRSSRSIRRENERLVVAFGIKVKAYIETEWWDSFKYDQKLSIYESWGHYHFMNCKNYTSKQQEELSFKSWITFKYENIKPEKLIYRDNKLNKLFNENENNYENRYKKGS